MLHYTSQLVVLKDVFIFLIVLVFVAYQNMFSIVITLHTTQLEMSLLNAVAPQNMRPMLVALDASHFDISFLNAAAL